MNTLLALAPHVAAWREQGFVDRWAFEKAGELGYLLTWADEQYGGAGYMDEYRISRMYADARVSRIFAGSNEIMKEIVGRGLGLDERRKP